MKCQKIIFVALYSVTVASRQRRFPCHRRRQDLGVNKNPPLNKEDFDLEEGVITGKRPSVQHNASNECYEAIFNGTHHALHQAKMTHAKGHT